MVDLPLDKHRKHRSDSFKYPAICPVCTAVSIKFEINKSSPLFKVLPKLLTFARPRYSSFPLLVYNKKQVFF